MQIGFSYPRISSRTKRGCFAYSCCCCFYARGPNVLLHEAECTCSCNGRSSNCTSCSTSGGSQVQLRCHFESCEFEFGTNDVSACCCCALQERVQFRWLTACRPTCSRCACGNVRASEVQLWCRRWIVQRGPRFHDCFDDTPEGRGCRSQSYVLFRVAVNTD